MESIKKSLPSKIFEIIDRAGISTVKQLITLSKWDIKKITNLSSDDIFLLKTIVADHISSKCITSDLLLQEQNEYPKISSGCDAVDSILKGGYRRGTLTEIYGESGSGKTQMGIQAAAHNSYRGCVYICTEDLFPVKRLEQIKHGIPNYSEEYYGKNIFIEHVTEPNELISCVKVRLPRLLISNKVSFIVIDSIAAPYRTDLTNYIQRAEDLRELAMALIGLAQKHNIAVLCINQVTAAFDSADNVLPSLGLAWSNMVSSRLCLVKTSESIGTDEPSSIQNEYSQIRELSVVFAPDLGNKTARFIIKSTGIIGV